MLKCLFLWFVIVLAPARAATDKSIYEISPYRDGAIILAGTLATCIPYALFPVRHVCPCPADEVNGFDRWAIGNNSSGARLVSDVIVGAALVLPLTLNAFDVGWSNTFLEDAVVFAEVLAVSSGLVTITKYAVQRPLPLAYSGELAGQDEGYRAFYSGHTSTAFAALSATAFTLSRRYSLGLAPWLGAFALGSAVGVTRVLGGNHFPTDVIVGALAGSAVGILIPYFHFKKDKSESLIIVPQAGNGVQFIFGARL